MAVGKRIRFEVFKRDSFTCQYCGKSAPDIILHVDHIEPISKGGDDDITNLITSCRDCNLGKSNIELDDDAAIKKRKAQLDELQERREQLEMMMEWHKSLIDIDGETVSAISNFFSELYDWKTTVNESGEKRIKKWLKKYTVDEILTAMRSSYEAYGEDPEKAFSYTSRICNVKRAEKDKPYLRDIFYIRGILRNRFSYCNEWKAKQILEDAFVAGYEKEELKQIAIDCRNWTEWRSTMEAYCE